MILIASGAYLQGEFASEVGLLPPSFLPIGNRRLYEYQFTFLKDCYSDMQDVYLSVPVSYDIDAFDVKRLHELGIEILKVPEGLSLGDSLLYCWNATAKHHNYLTLLHGDTLFLNTCFEEGDTVSVHTNQGFYKRATLGAGADALEYVHDDWSNDSEQVISGFFSFKDPLFFMKSLVESKSDFVQAIIRYHKKKCLSLLSNGDWLDFGHINSFYHSRTRMTTQRSFNDLNIGLRLVSKASKGRPKKIYAEGFWFDQLPLSLRLYTPALLGLTRGDENYRNASYQLEYLYLLPLSDLFVFSRLSIGFWKTIFDSIAQILQEFSSYQPEVLTQATLTKINDLYLPKTLDRLQEYENRSGFSVHQEKISLIGDDFSLTLVELAQESARFIRPALQRDVSIVHGDLCFSNMLFDGRVEAIKCIDPRGITPDGQFSLYGDRRYDVAKTYHSVIGLYDLIVAGHFELVRTDEGQYDLKFSLNKEHHLGMIAYFREMVLQRLDFQEKEILAITVHLFLSMLPLHSDCPDRQQAFIANAYRLFKLLRELD